MKKESMLILTVVSLVSGILVNPNGDGTSENPYVVK